MIIQLFNLVVLNLLLKCLLSSHPQQIIIGHLNISSIRNKFGTMKPMLMHDIDIFMIT